MWTQFWDMHSGGGTKEAPYEKIYIEAPEKEAKVIFYNRFGHNPERVTCTCCGDDYSISEEETLEQLTAYHRNCDYAYFDKNGKEVPKNEAWVSGKGLKKGYSNGYVERAKVYDFDKSYKVEHIPLSDYVKQKDVLVIYAKDIKPNERIGEVPEQGYVWMD